MTAHQIVHRYMEIFFSGRKMDRLYKVLATDLHFSGPFIECHSAADYVGSLEADPPRNCRYRIEHQICEGDTVVLIYLFSKEGVNSWMSQLFVLRDEKIVRIHLIYDTGDFFSDASQTP